MTTVNRLSKSNHLFNGHHHPADADFIYIYLFFSSDLFFYLLGRPTTQHCVYIYIYVYKTKPLSLFLSKSLSRRLGDTGAAFHDGGAAAHLHPPQPKVGQNFLITHTHTRARVYYNTICIILEYPMKKCWRVDLDFEKPRELSNFQQQQQLQLQQQ